MKRSAWGVCFSGLRQESGGEDGKVGGLFGHAIELSVVEVGGYER